MEKGLAKDLLPTYRLYRQSALRLGHDVAYPAWMGSYLIARHTVPHIIGITEESLENAAGDKWPLPTPSDTLSTAPAAPGPRLPPTP